MSAIEIKKERIVSFDILRGWAIIGNLMVHSFMLMCEVQGIAETNPAELSFMGFVFMGLIVLFGHWRGLFLFLSAAIHLYIMQKKFRKGVSRHKILRQELLKASLLWLWAMFFYVFLAQWGPSKQLIETGSISLDWRKIYHADQFANIAWAVAISAIVFFLATNPKRKYPVQMQVVVFVILGLICIFIAPSVHQAANEFWGIDFHTGDHTNHIGIVGNWDYIARLFVNQFVAAESPLLPNFAYSASGAILGLSLSSPKLNRKRFLAWGYTLAVISLIFSIFWLFMVHGIPADPMSLANFHIHPTWFVFFSIGLQLIVILSFLAIFELNPRLKEAKLEKYLNRYHFSRKMGAYSLSVYSLGSIQIISRFLFWGIFLLIGADNPEMFRTSLGLPLFWTVVLMVSEVGMWMLIMKGWTKLHFVGTIDWFFSLLLKPPQRKVQTKEVTTATTNTESRELKWWEQDRVNYQAIMVNPIIPNWS